MRKGNLIKMAAPAILSAAMMVSGLPVMAADFTADTVMSRADSLYDLVFRVYSQCAGFDLLVCAGSVWFLPCGGSLAVAAGKLGNVYEKGRDDRRRCNRDIVLHRGDSVCVIVDRSATNR